MRKGTVRALAAIGALASAALPALAAGIPGIEQASACRNQAGLVVVRMTWIAPSPCWQPQRLSYGLGEDSPVGMSVEIEDGTILDPGSLCMQVITTNDFAQVIDLPTGISAIDLELDNPRLGALDKTSLTIGDASPDCIKSGILTR